MYCSKCGQEIEDDAKFCSFCGAGINNSSPSLPPTSNLPPLPPVAAITQPDLVVNFGPMGSIRVNKNTCTFFLEVYNTKNVGLFFPSQIRTKRIIKGTFKFSQLLSYKSNESSNLRLASSNFIKHVKQIENKFLNIDIYLDDSKTPSVRIDFGTFFFLHSLENNKQHEKALVTYNQILSALEYIRQHANDIPTQQPHNLTTSGQTVSVSDKNVGFLKVALIFVFIFVLLGGMIECSESISSNNKSSNLSKTSDISKPYQATIADNAIKSNVSADILENYSSKYPAIDIEFETILNKAAQLVAACKSCDHIVEVAYDDYESTADTLKIYVDCKNGKRVVLSVDEINNNTLVTPERFSDKPAHIENNAVAEIDEKLHKEIIALHGNEQAEKMKNLLPVAAQLVARIKSCKGVEKVGYEDYESTKDSLLVYVDCKNNKRVLLTLPDIETKKKLSEDDLKPKPHIAPIDSNACWEYPETPKELNKQGYSKSLKKLGLENIKRSNKLLPLAAKKAARNKRCDKVTYVAVSLDKSTKDNIVYCVIAENNYKYYFTEKELYEKGPVLSEVEKLEPLFAKHELLAEAVIKSKLTHPSTYDKHFFSSSSRTTNSCNEFLIVFSAQNSFGLKLTYEALVQFDKDSKLVGFRMQEKR